MMLMPNSLLSSFDFVSKSSYEEGDKREIDTHAEMECEGQFFKGFT